MTLRREYDGFRVSLRKIIALRNTFMLNVRLNIVVELPQLLLVTLITKISGLLISAYLSP